MITKIFSMSNPSKTDIKSLKQYVESPDFLNDIFNPSTFLSHFIPYAIFALHNNKPEKNKTFTHASDVRLFILKTLSKLPLKSVQSSNLLTLLNFSLTNDNIRNQMLTLKTFYSLSKSEMFKNEMLKEHVFALRYFLVENFNYLDSCDESQADTSLFFIVEILEYVRYLSNSFKHTVPDLEPIIAVIYTFFRSTIDDPRKLEYMFHTKFMRIKFVNAISVFLGIAHDIHLGIPRASLLFSLIPELSQVAIYYCPADTIELKRRLYYLVSKFALENRDAFIPCIDKFFSRKFFYSPDHYIMNLKGLTILNKLNAVFKDKISKNAYFEFTVRTSEILQECIIKVSQITRDYIYVCKSESMYTDEENEHLKKMNTNGFDDVCGHDFHNILIINKISEELLCLKEELSDKGKTTEVDATSKEATKTSTLVYNSSIKLHLEALAEIISIIKINCYSIKTRHLEPVERNRFYMKNFYDLYNCFMLISQRRSYSIDNKRLIKYIVSDLVEALKEILNKISSIDSSASDTSFTVTDMYKMHAMYYQSFEIFSFDIFNMEDITLDTFYSFYTALKENIYREVIRMNAKRIILYTAKHPIFFKMWDTFLYSSFSGNIFLHYILSKMNETLFITDYTFYTEAIVKLVRFCNKVEVSKTVTFHFNKLLHTLFNAAPDNLHYYNILKIILTIFRDKKESSSYFSKYIYDNVVKIVDHLMNRYETYGHMIFLELIFTIPISLNFIEADTGFILKPISYGLRVPSLRAKALSILSYLLDFSKPNINSNWFTIFRFLMSDKSKEASKILGKIKTHHRQYLIQEPELGVSIYYKNMLTLEMDDSVLNIDRLLINSIEYFKGEPLCNTDFVNYDTVRMFIEVKRPMYSLQGGYCRRCEMKNHNSNDYSCIDKVNVSTNNLGKSTNTGGESRIGSKNANANSIFDEVSSRHCSLHKIANDHFSFLTNVFCEIMGWSVYEREGIEERTVKRLKAINEEDSMIKKADIKIYKLALIARVNNTSKEETIKQAQYLYDILLALFKIHSKPSLEILKYAYKTVIVYKVIEHYSLFQKRYKMFFDSDVLIDALIESFSFNGTESFEILNYMFSELFLIDDNRHTSSLGYVIYKLFVTQLSLHVQSSSKLRRESAINGMLGAIQLDIPDGWIDEMAGKFVRTCVVYLEKCDCNEKFKLDGCIKKDNNYYIEFQSKNEITSRSIENAESLRGTCNTDIANNLESEKFSQHEAGTSYLDHGCNNLTPIRIIGCLMRKKVNNKWHKHIINGLFNPKRKIRLFCMDVLDNLDCTVSLLNKHRDMIYNSLIDTKLDVEHRIEVLVYCISAGLFDKQTCKFLIQYFEAGIGNCLCNDSFELSRINLNCATSAHHNMKPPACNLNDKIHSNNVLVSCTNTVGNARIPLCAIHAYSFVLEIDIESSIRYFYEHNHRNRLKEAYAMNPNTCMSILLSEVISLIDSKIEVSTLKKMQLVFNILDIGSNDIEEINLLLNENDRGNPTPNSGYKEESKLGFDVFFSHRSNNASSYVSFDSISNDNLNNLLHVTRKTRDFILSNFAEHAVSKEYAIISYDSNYSILASLFELALLFPSDNHLCNVILDNFVRFDSLVNTFASEMLERIILYVEKNFVFIKCIAERIYEPALFYLAKVVYFNSEVFRLLVTYPSTAAHSDKATADFPRHHVLSSNAFDDLVPKRNECMMADSFESDFSTEKSRKNTLVRTKLEKSSIEPSSYSHYFKSALHSVEHKDRSHISPYNLTYIFQFLDIIGYVFTPNDIFVALKLYVELKKKTKDLFFMKQFIIDNLIHFSAENLKFLFRVEPTFFAPNTIKPSQMSADFSLEFKVLMLKSVKRYKNDLELQFESTNDEDRSFEGKESESCSGTESLTYANDKVSKGYNSMDESTCTNDKTFKIGNNRDSDNSFNMKYEPCNRAASDGGQDACLDTGDVSQVKKQGRFTSTQVHNKDGGECEENMYDVQLDAKLIRDEYEHLIDIFAENSYYLIEMFVETSFSSPRMIHYCKNNIYNKNLQYLVLYYLCTFEPLYVYFELALNLEYEQRKFTLCCLEKVVDVFDPVIFEDLLLKTLRSESKHMTNYHIVYPLLCSRPKLITDTIVTELFTGINRLLMTFKPGDQRLGLRMFNTVYAYCFKDADLKFIRETSYSYAKENSLLNITERSSCFAGEQDTKGSCYDTHTIGNNVHALFSKRDVGNDIGSYKEGRNGFFETKNDPPSSNKSTERDEYTIDNSNNNSAKSIDVDTMFNRVSISSEENSLHLRELDSTSVMFKSSLSHYVNIMSQLYTFVLVNLFNTKKLVIDEIFGCELLCYTKNLSFNLDLVNLKNIQRFLNNILESNKPEEHKSELCSILKSVLDLNTLDHNIVFFMYKHELLSLKTILQGNVLPYTVYLIYKKVSEDVDRSHDIKLSLLNEEPSIELQTNNDAKEELVQFDMEVTSKVINDVGVKCSKNCATSANYDFGVVLQLLKKLFEIYASRAKIINKNKAFQPNNEETNVKMQSSSLEAVRLESNTNDNSSNFTRHQEPAGNSCSSVDATYMPFTDDVYAIIHEVISDVFDKIDLLKLDYLPIINLYAEILSSKTTDVSPMLYSLFYIFADKKVNLKLKLKLLALLKDQEIIPICSSTNDVDRDHAKTYDTQYSVHIEGVKADSKFNCCMNRRCSNNSCMHMTNQCHSTVSDGYEWVKEYNLEFTCALHEREDIISRLVFILFKDYNISSLYPLRKYFVAGLNSTYSVQFYDLLDSYLPTYPPARLRHLLTLDYSLLNSSTIASIFIKCLMTLYTSFNLRCIKCWTYGEDAELENIWSCDLRHATSMNRNIAGYLSDTILRFSWNVLKYRQTNINTKIASLLCDQVNHNIMQGMLAAVLKKMTVQEVCDIYSEFRNNILGCGHKQIVSAFIAAFIGYIEHKRAKKTVFVTCDVKNKDMLDNRSRKHSTRDGFDVCATGSSVVGNNSCNLASGTKNGSLTSSYTLNSFGSVCAPVVDLYTEQEVVGCDDKSCPHKVNNRCPTFCSYDRHDLVTRYLSVPDNDISIIDEDACDSTHKNTPDSSCLCTLRKLINRDIVDLGRNSDAWHILLEYATGIHKLSILRELNCTASYYGFARFLSTYPETMQALLLQQFNKPKECQALLEEVQQKAIKKKISYCPLDYFFWESEWKKSAHKLQQWDILEDKSSAWHGSSFTNSADLKQFHKLVFKSSLGSSKCLNGKKLGLFRNSDAEVFSRMEGSKPLNELTSVSYLEEIRALIDASNPLEDLFYKTFYYTCTDYSRPRILDFLNTINLHKNKSLLLLQIATEMLEASKVFKNEIENEGDVLSLLFMWKNREPGCATIEEWNMFSMWRKHVYERIPFSTMEETSVDRPVSGINLGFNNFINSGANGIKPSNLRMDENNISPSNIATSNIAFSNNFASHPQCASNPSVYSPVVSPHSNNISNSNPALDLLRNSSYPVQFANSPSTREIPFMPKTRDVIAAMHNNRAQNITCFPPKHAYMPQSGVNPNPSVGMTLNHRNQSVNLGGFSNPNNSGTGLSNFSNKNIAKFNTNSWSTSCVNIKLSQNQLSSDNLAAHNDSNGLLQYPGMNPSSPLNVIPNSNIPVYVSSTNAIPTNYGNGNCLSNDKVQHGDPSYVPIDKSNNLGNGAYTDRMSSSTSYNANSMNGRYSKGYNAKMTSSTNNSSVYLDNSLFVNPNLGQTGNYMENQAINTSSFDKNVKHNTSVGDNSKQLTENTFVANQFVNGQFVNTPFSTHVSVSNLCSRTNPLHASIQNNACNINGSNLPNGIPPDTKFTRSLKNSLLTKSSHELASLYNMLATIALKNDYVDLSNLILQDINELPSIRLNDAFEKIILELKNCYVQAEYKLGLELSNSVNISNFSFLQCSSIFSYKARFCEKLNRDPTKLYLQSVQICNTVGINWYSWGIYLMKSLVPTEKRKSVSVYDGMTLSKEMVYSYRKVTKKSKKRPKDFDLDLSEIKVVPKDSSLLVTERVYENGMNNKRNDEGKLTMEKEKSSDTGKKMCLENREEGSSPKLGSTHEDTPNIRDDDKKAKLVRLSESNQLDKNDGLVNGCNANSNFINSSSDQTAIASNTMKESESVEDKMPNTKDFATELANDSSNDLSACITELFHILTQAISLGTSSLARKAILKLIDLLRYDEPISDPYLNFDVSRFIFFIPELLPLLDSSNANTIKQVLLLIGEEYPEAVYLHLRVTRSLLQMSNIRAKYLRSINDCLACVNKPSGYGKMISYLENAFYTDNLASESDLFSLLSFLQTEVLNFIFRPENFSVSDFYNLYNKLSSYLIMSNVNDAVKRQLSKYWFESDNYSCKLCNPEAVPNTYFNTKTCVDSPTEGLATSSSTCADAEKVGNQKVGSKFMQSHDSDAKVVSNASKQVTNSFDINQNSFTFQSVHNRLPSCAHQNNVGFIPSPKNGICPLRLLSFIDTTRRIIETAIRSSYKPNDTNYHTDSFVVLGLYNTIRDNYKHLTRVAQFEPVSIYTSRGLTHTNVCFVGDDGITYQYEIRRLHYVSEINLPRMAHFINAEINCNNMENFCHDASIEQSNPIYGANNSAFHSSVRFSPMLQVTCIKEAYYTFDSILGEFCRKIVHKNKLLKQPLMDKRGRVMCKRSSTDFILWYIEQIHEIDGGFEHVFELKNFSSEDLLLSEKDINGNAPKNEKGGSENMVSSMENSISTNITDRVNTNEAKTADSDTEKTNIMNDLHKEGTVSFDLTGSNKTSDLFDAPPQVDFKKDRFTSTKFLKNTCVNKIQICHHRFKFSKNTRLTAYKHVLKEVVPNKILSDFFKNIYSVKDYYSFKNTSLKTYSVNLIFYYTLFLQNRDLLNICIEKHNGSFKNCGMICNTADSLRGRETQVEFISPNLQKLWGPEGIEGKLVSIVYNYTSKINKKDWFSDLKILLEGVNEFCNWEHLDTMYQRVNKRISRVAEDPNQVIALVNEWTDAHKICLADPKCHPWF